MKGDIYKQIKFIIIIMIIIIIKEIVVSKCHISNTALNKVPLSIPPLNTGSTYLSLKDAAQKNQALTKLSLNKVCSAASKGRLALPLLVHVTSIMEHVCVSKKGPQLYGGKPYEQSFFTSLL